MNKEDIIFFLETLIDDVKEERILTAKSNIKSLQTDYEKFIEKKGLKKNELTGNIKK